MTKLIDSQELAQTQYAELLEGGEVWIHDNATFQDIKLDAQAAIKLFDFLLLHQDRLTRHVQGQEDKNEDKSEHPMQATRDWYTRAIVRVRETTTRGSVDPWRQRTFQTGEEVEMVQWGNKGQPVERNAWWTSYDIDGAFIIEASNIEVIRILDVVSPFDEHTL